MTVAASHDTGVHLVAEPVQAESGPRHDHDRVVLGADMVELQHDEVAGAAIDAAREQSLADGDELAGAPMAGGHAGPEPP